ncbi:MAG: SusD/RagB family nutrient-binding outer membrane lipoprotein [Gemmatimonadota bacterium]|nr:SusD/RagB family nutrient-binding outer membrane lipoprotein [Gemmatimonadota bacterium]
MTYRSFRLASLGAVVVLGLSACNPDKLTQINQDPNNPISAPPGPVFTFATRIAMQRWFGSNPTNMRGPVLTTQHLAQVQYPDEDSYSRLDGTVTDGSFINTYSQELKNFQAVIDAGKPDEQEMLWGPAQVMRSLIFGYITDVWGDVPYSQALKGDAADATLQPAYDAQKDIYTGLFADLKEAVDAMAAGASAVSVLAPVGSADPIYAGSRTRWERFGNSLRARHAMRLANVDPATAQAQLAAAIAAPGGLIASNADNAQLVWPGDGVYDNPWAANNRTRDDHRLSEHLLNEMIPVNDPRVAVYAQPTLCYLNPAATGCPASPAQYAGMPNALTATDAATWSLKSSRPGRVFYSTNRFCKTSFASGAYVGCTGLTGARFPSFVLTYAEVSFILAEAAERGWIAGSAAAYYNQAIQASMAQWGVTDATAIAAFLATPGIAYTPGPAGMRQIALQKWIALYTDGVEAWSEWRRTCVPATVTPGPAAVINTVPRRYEYSIREASVNSANMDAAVARQGADLFTTRIYWDKNPTAAPTYPGASCGVRVP